ncbi:peptidoglycan-binding protein [Streptomyces sp. NPDC093589]|uniref:peptidoglycan-binding protein n=1 Tax=Streptomyces sp. NPDC093589 TaxID=3366043 RepID=UPI00380059FC
MSTQQKATQETYYTVKAGDNLTTIAAHYHTTVKQVQTWNHIADANVIHVGQQLLVSKSEQPESQTTQVPQGCVPFPGKGWFESMPNSPIIVAMAYRLIGEGCASYSGDPGPWWNDEHRRSYSNWQRKLNFQGSEADGMPGRTSWDRLRVPAGE